MCYLPLSKQVIFLAYGCGDFDTNHLAAVIVPDNVV